VKHLSRRKQRQSAHWTHAQCHVRSRTLSRNLSTIGSWHPAHTTTIATPTSGANKHTNAETNYVTQYNWTTKPWSCFCSEYIESLLVAYNQRNLANQRRATCLLHTPLWAGDWQVSFKNDSKYLKYLSPSSVACWQRDAERSEHQWMIYLRIWRHARQGPITALLRQQQQQPSGTQQAFARICVKPGAANSRSSHVRRRGTICYLSATFCCQH